MVTAKGSSRTSDYYRLALGIVCSLASLVWLAESCWDGPHLHHWAEATWELVLSALLGHIADREATDA